jgi:hypothetical protein
MQGAIAGRAEHCTYKDVPGDKDAIPGTSWSIATNGAHSTGASSSAHSWRTAHTARRSVDGTRWVRGVAGIALYLAHGARGHANTRRNGKEGRKHLPYTVRDLRAQGIGLARPPAHRVASRPPIVPIVT